MNTNREEKKKKQKQRKLKYHFAPINSKEAETSEKTTFYT